MVSIRVTKDIILNELKKADAAQLFSVVDSNRSYLKEWLPWLDFSKTTDDSLQFIKNSLEQRKQNKCLILGIWTKTNIIGTISLVEINLEDKFAEIGYWLAEKEQGKGIVTLSCQALINYAFNNLAIDTIKIRCVSQNAKSLAVLTRLQLSCGEQEEKQWVKGEMILTKVTLGKLLKKEWINTKRSSYSPRESKDEKDDNSDTSSKLTLSNHSLLTEFNFDESSSSKLQHNRSNSSLVMGRLLDFNSNKTKRQIYNQLIKFNLFGENKLNRKMAYNHVASNDVTKKDFRILVKKLI